MLFFSLPSFSRFWDAGSFSFYNQGSHWQRNPSLLKMEDIAYLLTSPTFHAVGPAPKCKSVCCTLCVSGLRLGRVGIGAKWRRHRVCFWMMMETVRPSTSRGCGISACTASRVASTPVRGVEKEPFWAKSRHGIEHSLSQFFCSLRRENTENFKPGVLSVL